MPSIRVYGARTHNLKNISLEIPRGKLTVLTGLSGSGKSSLAFETLYAEGQRRYVESLSTYARQFLDLMPKPDVDAIDGLSPAIAIDQRSASNNPRSTVGTMTEIIDYLRLLFARVGVPYCPEHQLALEHQSIAQMVEKTLLSEREKKILVCSPVFQKKKGNFADFFAQMLAKGYRRFLIDGEEVVLEIPLSLEAELEHSIEVIVDRMTVRDELRERLAQSFEAATGLSEGCVLVRIMHTDTVYRYTLNFACPLCDYTAPELEPRLFSFNNPVGACPTCQGAGAVKKIDETKVVQFPTLSLMAGAIPGWDQRNKSHFSEIVRLAKKYEFDVNVPWSELDDKNKQLILYGEFLEQETKNNQFLGVIPTIEEQVQNKKSSNLEASFDKYRTTVVCPSCQGTRLRIEARNVFLGNGAFKSSLSELGQKSLNELLHFFENLTLDKDKETIAQRPLYEIKARLHFLNEVGLGYLNLQRQTKTLSGGEAQRIRLASQIGSGLTGVMYVLDEPSIGLHQQDNDKLLSSLFALRDLGNTVIVVEHDEDAMRQADWLVDMGPGAGEHGGEVVAVGTPAAVMQSEKSLTGAYLRGTKKIEIPQNRRTPKDGFFELKGATGHNLKGVDCRIPVGLFTVIAGLSGSGKSSLINDTLYPALANQLNHASLEELPYAEMINPHIFDKVIAVDQSSIGRTPRSNPATYTGLFTAIRDVFAKTQRARERGYESGRFSFNVKGGRCEACQGDGLVKVEMHFLPDVYVPCKVCGGTRYNRETLEVLYHGLNISEVLNLTVEEALVLFEAYPKIVRVLKALSDVGLGYIRLGQSALTLSGGEAQRVKLATELSRQDTGATLYVLDEPTTGLHFEDVRQLLSVINKLTEAGNTVIVIEHNLDVIKSADWVIELGPGAGQAGGVVVFEGTPEKLKECSQSPTAPYLKKYF